MSSPTIDAEGYVISESGATLGRLGEPGKVFLWDKRIKGAVALTLTELAQLWVDVALQKEREESHEGAGD